MKKLEFELLTFFPFVPFLPRTNYQKMMEFNSDVLKKLTLGMEQRTAPSVGMCAYSVV